MDQKRISQNDFDPKTFRYSIEFVSAIVKEIVSYTSCFQVWERNLEEYRHTLHHLPESRDPSNPILESASMGREQIISSLMNINTRYEKLLNEVQLIMEDVVDNLKRQGKEHKEVRFLSRRGLTLVWCEYEPNRNLRFQPSSWVLWFYRLLGVGGSDWLGFRTFQANQSKRKPSRL